MEDVDEANLLHLLERLGSDSSDLGTAFSAIRELINAINLKVLSLNKKSKKHHRTSENAPRGASDRC